MREHRRSSGSSSRYWVVGKKILLLERDGYLRVLEAICETRRTRASCARDPGGLEDDGLQYYCTSTVMVWVAATRAWSFVAPVTVIWCVPLLMPLKVP